MAARPLQGINTQVNCMGSGERLELLEQNSKHIQKEKKRAKRNSTKKPYILTTQL